MNGRAIHLDTGTGPRCGRPRAFGLTSSPGAVTCALCLIYMAGTGTTLGVRHEDWQLAPHGTLAAARRHYRRGERPCESCLQAESRNWADRGPAINEARALLYRQARDAGMTRAEARIACKRGAA